jgi:hypothetical protein
MLRFVSFLLATAVAGVLGSGCGKSLYRTGEGVYCSSNTSEDPQYKCIQSVDYVCITTYKAEGTQEPIYLCRLACSPGEACPLGGICCPGEIHGKDYGKTHACVPVGKCSAIPKPDGGAPDALKTDGGGTDGGDSPDAGAPDGETPDSGAPSDAAPADAAADAAEDGAVADAADDGAVDDASASGDAELDAGSD